MYNLTINKMKNVRKKVGYCVFEYNSNGGKHPVSKPYSTWLGAKRVRNVIRRELKNLVGYKWTVEPFEYVVLI